MTKTKTKPDKQVRRPLDLGRLTVPFSFVYASDGILCGSACQKLGLYTTRSPAQHAPPYLSARAYYSTGLFSLSPIRVQIQIVVLLPTNSRDSSNITATTTNNTTPATRQKKHRINDSMRKRNKSNNTTATTSTTKDESIIERE